MSINLPFALSWEVSLFLWHDMWDDIWDDIWDDDEAPWFSFIAPRPLSIVLLTLSPLCSLCFFCFSIFALCSLFVPGCGMLWHAVHVRACCGMLWNFFDLAVRRQAGRAPLQPTGSLRA